MVRRLLAGGLLVALCATAATRPRYGGTLRVEVREPVELADPPTSGRLADPLPAFQISRWEPGRRAVFTADDNAPGGRPFVDTVEVEFGRPHRDQALDLEVGKADLVEAGQAELRRIRRVWASQPVRLVVLVAGPRLPDAVRQSLALAIDRAPIHSGLLQRQGDATAALLPQWMTGYAFMFPTQPDLVKARALVAPLPNPARVFSIGYDPAVPQARAIADRVALNARDAGLMAAVVGQGNADLRLVEVRLGGPEPAVALAGVAAALGLGEVGRAATPEALYNEERALLDGARVIPLFHLPELYGAGPRVRTWLAPAIGKMGDWRLESVWLERK